VEDEDEEEEEEEERERGGGGERPGCFWRLSRKEQREFNSSSSRNLVRKLSSQLARERMFESEIEEEERQMWLE
jgi:hypothetical protein